MRRLVYALIGLGLVAILVIGWLQSRENREATPTSAGVPTLTQALHDVAGSPAPLSSLHKQANRLLGGNVADYRGRLTALRGHPVVVNFWGSWCGPCILEFPIFQRTAAKLGRSVAFVGVDVEDNDAAARRFLRGHPVIYPSYRDPRRSIIGGLLGAQGTPTTAYYDRAGHVTYVHQGPYGSDAQLTRDVRRYLGAA